MLNVSEVTFNPDIKVTILFNVFLSFFLFWDGIRSLRMPALRPALQAGPMRDAREGTSVVLRDTIRLI